MSKILSGLRQQMAAVSQQRDQQERHQAAKQQQLMRNFIQSANNTQLPTSVRPAPSLFSLIVLKRANEIRVFRQMKAPKKNRNTT